MDVIATTHLFGVTNRRALKRHEAERLVEPAIERLVVLEEAILDNAPTALPALAHVALLMQPAGLGGRYAIILRRGNDEGIDGACSCTRPPSAAAAAAAAAATAAAAAVAASKRSGESGRLAESSCISDGGRILLERDTRRPLRRPPRLWCTTASLSTS